MVWPVSIFLLFGRSLAEDEEYVLKSTHKTEDLRSKYPVDFRCSKLAHSRFIFTTEVYRPMKYVFDPSSPDPFGCYAQPKTYYPILTALDPMMTFYIHKIYEGIAIIKETNGIISANTPSVASTLTDYYEIFHSDEETCWKLKEIVKECSGFRQMWIDWVRNIYEKLCLDEDGCYNMVKFYDEDMPYCVKYIATSQFKNATFGSWHHSILNYCELTDMVPQAEDDNYFRSIINEDGKTEDELLTMCQFLRFRLLPEEGKEEEIREIALIRKGKETDSDSDQNNLALYPELAYVTIIMLIYVA